MNRQNAPISETDIFANINDPVDVFKNPVQLLFVRTLIDILRRALTGAVKQNQASPHIILSAPDGGAWIVEVDNTGALTTRNARA